MKTLCGEISGANYIFAVRRRSALQGWVLSVVWISLPFQSLAAGVTLTSGNSTVSIDPFNTLGMNTWYVDGQNQLYQQWFWYRVETPKDRGLVAMAKSENEVYLGWRALHSDPAQGGYNVYRSTDGGVPVRLNDQPIHRSTDFTDKTASLSKSNYWELWSANKAEFVPIDSAKLPAGTQPKPYVSIRLQGDYPFSKVGIADLDGDGKLDYVIKQPQQVSDPWTSP